MKRSVRHESTWHPGPGAAVRTPEIKHELKMSGVRIATERWVEWAYLGRVRQPMSSEAGGSSTRLLEAAWSPDPRALKRLDCTYERAPGQLPRHFTITGTGKAPARPTRHSAVSLLPWTGPLLFGARVCLARKSSRTFLYTGPADHHPMCLDQHTGTTHMGLPPFAHSPPS